MRHRQEQRRQGHGRTGGHDGEFQSSTEGGVLTLALAPNPGTIAIHRG